MTRIFAASLAFLVLAGANSLRAADTLQTVTLPDGRHLGMTCIGAGKPTIVLESGLGLPAQSWRKVAPQLGQLGRTCAYNRAGYAQSDPGPMPRDAIHVASDLQALLAAADLSGPYILIGHSLGAQYVRYFALQHPAKVLGLVLIDPDFRDLDRLVGASSSANAKELAQSSGFIRKCIGSIAIGRSWSSTDPGFADCGPPPARSDAATQAMAQASLSEFKNRGSTAAQVSRGIEKPAPYPIIVLTADRSNPPLSATSLHDRAAMVTVMTREHQKIAATSMIGRERLVPNTGHLIQIDQPQAVIAAVRDILAVTKTTIQ